MSTTRRVAAIQRADCVVMVASFDVCFWHFSDLPTPLTNVGYQGKSGSKSDIAKATRLTPSRSRACLLKSPLLLTRSSETLAPRITILSASSCNGRCNAFGPSTARASKHRAFIGGQDHGHGFGMDRRDHLFWRLPGQLAHTYERL
jgi:hypothetical protein